MTSPKSLDLKVIEARIAYATSTPGIRAWSGVSFEEVVALAARVRELEKLMGEMVGVFETQDEPEDDRWDDLFAKARSSLSGESR